MSRGSEEQFQALLTELHKNTKNYEEKKIKHTQWTEQTEALFSSFSWTKAEFYKELNSRLGIETNETREKKRKKKVVAKPVEKKKAPPQKLKFDDWRYD